MRRPARRRAAAAAQRDELLSRRVPTTLTQFIQASSGWHQLWLLIISTLVFLMSTAPLEVQRRLINGALKGQDYHPILVLAGLYAALALGEGLLKLVMNMYRAWISEHAVRSLRRSIDALLNSRSAHPGEADQTGIGVSMILAEAEPIGGFVGSAVSEPLLQAGILASVLAYMIYLHPMMAVVAVAVFSPQMIFVPLVQRAINARVKQRIKTLRKVSVTVTTETRDEAPQVQRRRIDRVLALNLGIFQLKFSSTFAMNMLTHLGTAGVLALGGWYVVQGETEIGTVVAFVAGLAKITDPWRDLVAWYRDMHVARAKYALFATAVQTMLAESQATAGRSAAQLTP